MFTKITAELAEKRILCAPDDIASTMVFLASDEASFVTGAVLEVDGGRCI